MKSYQVLTEGTGTCGLLFGATSGIIRGSPVALFSLFTGAQWFSLASVFVGMHTSHTRLPGLLGLEER